MVVHHWSDDGMVMYHRWSLLPSVCHSRQQQQMADLHSPVLPNTFQCFQVLPSVSQPSASQCSASQCFPVLSSASQPSASQFFPHRRATDPIIRAFCSERATLQTKNTNTNCNRNIPRCTSDVPDHHQSTTQGECCRSGKYAAIWNFPENPLRLSFLHLVTEWGGPAPLIEFSHES